MKFYINILTISFLIAIRANAQQDLHSVLADKAAYREHSLDITKMKVDVRFEPEKGKVLGSVVHSFIVLQQKVDSVFFDAPAITIKSVVCNEKPAKYKTDKNGVWVYPTSGLQWEQSGTIRFDYEATPKRGIYFIGWNVQAPAEQNPFAVRKQIWTQGQGIDNRHWIPMYDDMNDKFITETVITFDKNYKVLSNGKLLKKKDNGNGTFTWNYAMSKPHAGYLLMLTIGNYAVYETKSAGGVPLQYWYYPEFADRMEPTYRYTPLMMDFLEKETGIKYPWESYSQVMVQDFIYGAMENTTATIFGDFFNVDARAFLDRNYIGVNCHEMTHQWFGDYITARDGRDTWLQESYATYWPKQLTKVLDGTEEWDWQRRAHQNAAIEAGKKDNFPVRHTQGGTARVYPKGAAVISMLEYVLGEEQWKRALNHYLKTNAYANVETNDLQQAIKDKLGLNLDWFFDEWIYRGAEPSYEVSYQDMLKNAGHTTEISVKQTHKTSETVRWFKMPIWFEVHYNDGSYNRVQRWVENQTETISITNPAGKAISFVLFDANSNIIKQVTFPKTPEELKQQLARAPYYLDRYDALLALRETAIEQKRNALLAALKKETHHGILNELVGQLIHDKDPASVAAMQSLLNYKQKASTREAVLKGLTSITPAWRPFYIQALNDSSYDVMRAAMDKLFSQFDDEDTYKIICDRSKYVLGMNNAIQIKRHEIIAIRDAREDKRKEAIHILAAYASAQYEFRTRINAFAALKSVNALNDEICQNIFNAIVSSNARLAGPAVELANHFALQFRYKEVMKKIYAGLNNESGQKDTIKKQLPWIEY